MKNDREMDGDKSYLVGFLRIGPPQNAKLPL
jgi:hypothetical protein